MTDMFPAGNYAGILFLFFLKEDVHQLQPVFDADFFIDIIEMLFNSFQRDIDLIRDVAVGVTVQNKRNYFLFARG